MIFGMFFCGTRFYFVNYFHIFAVLYLLFNNTASNNHRGSNKPSDHSQRQKPLPSPYQHQHRNQQQNGHMITDVNDDDDDGVYERTASTIPNTESSLAHSHDVDDSSEMALVLAHPTPSGSYSGT